MQLALNAIERTCKDYYLKGLNPADYIDSDEAQPDTSKPNLSAFKEESHILFFKTLNCFHEDKFIPPGYDVWLMHAPRYVPVKNHSHDFLELVYVYQGSCTQYLNDIPYPMAEGELYFLAPGTSHHIFIEDDDCIVFHIMARESTFDTAFLSLLNHDDALSTFFALSVFNSNKETFLRFRTAKDERMSEMVLQMFESSQANDAYTSRLLNILFEWVCLHVVKNYLDKVEFFDNGAFESNITGILNFISKNYRTVTVDSLCSHFNYSRGHLQRIIKKHTGMTFSQILHSQKIKHACQLIKNKGMKINDIFEQVGFNNLRHFQRVFKSQTNVTPTAYRQMTL